MSWGNILPMIKHLNINNVNWSVCLLKITINDIVCFDSFEIIIFIKDFCQSIGLLHSNCFLYEERRVEVNYSYDYKLREFVILFTYRMSKKYSFIVVLINYGNHAYWIYFFFSYKTWSVVLSVGKISLLLFVAES